MSEPNAGSDAFGLQTTAKKDSDGGYIINGSKSWISNSGEADTFLVFANVDPSKGYKGITCFVMSKDMGVQIAKREKKVRNAILVIETRNLHYSWVSGPRPLVSWLSTTSKYLKRTLSERSARATRSPSRS